ncbi:MAG: 6-bladed beta-propeller [Gemmatimonadetes bacterium]|nr:6-bladed beta-propeller [Gemmatimonadota bacterium]NNM04897.1 6-bladed beta-propeller [Gemmatimonadota bacterium]
MNTRSKFPILLLLVSAIPILQACGDAGAWEGTIADSAGVTVVHNTATPIWRAGAGWTVAEDLRIGTVAGDPEYQFGQIMPLSSIDVDSQGNIYVMDLQAQEARVFDATGQYVKTLGGPGAGPGEFSQQAAFIFVDQQDRILVPDLGLQRVTMFTSAGEASGSFPIQIQAGVPARWTVDAQGRIMAQLRGLNVEGVASLEEGDPIVVYDTTGAVVDTVALLPKGQTIEGLTEEEFSMVLFAPEPVWDLDAAGSVYYAMNDQYRILVNNPEGVLTRVITREVENKPVEESDQTAILRTMREQYAQFGVPPAQIEFIMGGIRFAENYPVFGLIFYGPGETLWAQRIRSARDLAEGADEDFEFNPQEIGSPEWEVFDNQGRWLGVVTLPDRFAPVKVDGDHLYGVWSDELDVQYVVRLLVDRTNT